MRRPFWLEQILRSRRPKPRSNGVDAHRKNRRRTIPSCSALSTWSLHSRFIKNGNVSPLEERIGYKFRNSLFLAEALTHPSFGHETQRHHFDNQRLEFLGDAVLQLIITEHLFQHFGGEAEGQLTKLRSQLVSRERAPISSRSKKNRWTSIPRAIFRNCYKVFHRAVRSMS